jgi:hypothetical protein
MIVRRKWIVPAYFATESDLNRTHAVTDREENGPGFSNDEFISTEETFRWMP